MIPNFYLKINTEFSNSIGKKSEQNIASVHCPARNERSFFRKEMNQVFKEAGGPDPEIFAEGRFLKFSNRTLIYPPPTPPHHTLHSCFLYACCMHPSRTWGACSMHRENKNRSYGSGKKSCFFKFPFETFFAKSFISHYLGTEGGPEHFFC
jgi:hypothetical protein